MVKLLWMTVTQDAVSFICIAYISVYTYNFVTITAANDVTKQKDLSGFYRHLLSQTTNVEDSTKKEEEEEQEDSSNTGRHRYVMISFCMHVKLFLIKLGFDLEKS